jgi:hypothetical protein
LKKKAKKLKQKIFEHLIFVYFIIKNRFLVYIDRLTDAVAGFKKAELLSERLEKTAVEVLHSSPVDVRHAYFILIRIGIVNVSQPKILINLKFY